MFKNHFLLAFLACSIIVSCSNEITDNIILEEETETSIPDNSEAEEEAETSNEEIVFKVTVDDAPFSAYEIKADVHGDKIRILATNEDQTASVYLFFNPIVGEKKLLGRSIENIDDDVAGYFLNTKNIGFVTSEMYEVCGEIFLENYNQNKLSGTFYFDACNNKNHVKRLSNGVFKNIPITVK